MPHEAKRLIRDPGEWATDNGWISRRRGVNIAARIEALAVIIEDTLYQDDAGDMWAKELRLIGKTIAPTKTPVERRIAAMREP